MRAESDGAAGNRRASVGVTSSALMVSFLVQGRKPSLTMRTVYSPGARLRVSSVAVTRRSSMKTWADFGYEVAERSPVPWMEVRLLVGLKR